MASPTFISQYPGVSWLVFSLPKLVAPAFLVYIFVSSSLGLLVGWEFLDGSRWKVAAASTLTFPIAFFCSITWNRLRIAYRARRLGAITPPVIAGGLPGSLDIVWRSAKSRFTAYPGERSILSVVPRARRLLRSLLPHGRSLLFLILLRALTVTHRFFFRCAIGDYVDEWLRESDQTMIFRILFEDRVSGKPLGYVILDLW